MSIQKVSPTMEFEKNNPSIKIRAFVIKLNRHTCLDISNQICGMDLRRRNHEIREEQDWQLPCKEVTGWWYRAAEEMEKERGKN